MLLQSCLVPTTIYITLNYFGALDECKVSYSFQTGPFHMTSLLHTPPPHAMKAFLGIQPVALKMVLQALVQGPCTSNAGTYRQCNQFLVTSKGTILAKFPSHHAGRNTTTSNMFSFMPNL